MPTIVGNSHESVVQSYQILQKVKLMLNRGDSNETIVETIQYIENESERLTRNKLDI